MPQKRRYVVIMQFGNRPAAYRTVTMAETPEIAMNRMAFGWTFSPDKDEYRARFRVYDVEGWDFECTADFDGVQFKTLFGNDVRIPLVYNAVRVCSKGIIYGAKEWKYAKHVHSEKDADKIESADTKMCRDCGIIARGKTARKILSQFKKYGCKSPKIIMEIKN